ncbi:MAG: hypothetical protein ACTSRC_07920 [Candidatus Helarchaeota archaeon]
MSRTEKMSQVINLHYDYLFKVVLIGEEEHVKTGLLWAFTGSNNIISDYKLTIGVNFGISSVFLEDATLKLQIWDISYDPRVKLLRPPYFKGSSGCILVIRSLEEARYYLKEMKTYTNKPLPIYFILITDNRNQSEITEFQTQLNVEIVNSGYEGIEWLANTMLSYQRTRIPPTGALYVITTDEMQRTLQDLSQAQRHNELKRIEELRAKRAEQLQLLNEILEEMDIPVDHESVNIISAEVLFTVNILTGNVSAYPLKCDDCQNSCKNQRNLCIIPASDGYSTDLDKNSLLILSKVYALINNELPEHVLNQIKRITHCQRFKPA